MPDLVTSFALVAASYNAIQNVKLYRKQCEDLSGRCLSLLNSIQDSSRGLEGEAIVGIADELSVVIERIRAKVAEWSTWGRLKCVVQQSDMKDGLDRLNRDLDGCMMKFNVQANIETHRGHIDLRSIQERDNANIRELLLAIVKSHDEMKLLLNSHSSPVVEGVMENLQTQLMAPGLQPVEEEGFKAGLWKLHEQTSRLPPLTDLSGQISLLPLKPISGSSNDIYQGQWLDKQMVALRCPRSLDDSPATRKRFEREVSFWRQLDHPNVVPLYGIVNIDGKLLSVTPWSDNGNASNYVACFPSVDRPKLLYEIACGLEYLHEKTIVHGDLRADNILVSEDGVACLTDFGLSKFFEDCDRNFIPSHNASLRWAAPEVIRNGGLVSTHSDVWSFGMTCLEILSGRSPFHGKDDRAVERLLHHGKYPDRPGSISDRVWDLMLKCWSRDPERRPSMSVVKTSLQAIRSHSPVGRYVEETGSSESYSPESPSRKPALKKITTLFGRKSDEDKGRSLVTNGKAPSSNTLPITPPREQESLGRMNGYDWRVMDRSSSTHSYVTMLSMINSPSTSYAATTPSMVNSPFLQSLKPSPHQSGLNSSSKQGSTDNWRDENQKSPTYPSKAKASNYSRPSTGTSSSLRHWPSLDLYEIPDEDMNADGIYIPDNSGHRRTSYGHHDSMSSSRGTSRPSAMSSLMESSPRDIPLSSGDPNTSHDYPNRIFGQDSSTTGGAFMPSASSSLMELPPIDNSTGLERRNTSFDHPNLTLGKGFLTGGNTRSSTAPCPIELGPNDRSRHQSTTSDHPNLTSANSSSTGSSRSSTAPGLMEMPPSKSNSSNATSAEPPSLGMEFLSSSPPQILEGSLRRSPKTLPAHLRSSTMGSSQSTEPSQHVFVIQNAIETPHCILNATSGHVSSGTLEGLVQFLIDGFDSPRHTEYRDVFLMACAEFTTPDGLFQILSRRFVSEEKNPNAARRVVTQYNILMIISYWLKGGYLTPSQELLYRVKFFCEEIAQLKSGGTLLDRGNDLLDVVAVEIDKLRKPPRTSLEPGGIILQSSQVTPRDLAIGLTLLEGDNYGALHPSDYIMQLTKHQSAKLKKLYDTNNKIKTWVTESILHFNGVHERAEVLKFFVHAAVECQTMRNFSSAAAIASALHSTAVDNLRVTRKALTRNMQSKLSDLYDIINPESNHRGYREALHALTTAQETDACVPWMAFHLKELGKVLRVHPITVKEDGHQLINFNRYAKFMDRTKEIMYYFPPDLEENRHRGQLAYLLNQLRSIDLSDAAADRLVAKSRSLMSQEASDYRTRKPQLVKLGFDF